MNVVGSIRQSLRPDFIIEGVNIGQIKRQMERNEVGTLISGDFVSVMVSSLEIAISPIYSGPVYLRDPSSWTDLNGIAQQGVNILIFLHKIYLRIFLYIKLFKLFRIVVMMSPFFFIVFLASIVYSAPYRSHHLKNGIVDSSSHLR